MSNKKVAVSTWCSDDYREFIGIDQLSNSLKYFHPDIYHHIATQDWTPEMGAWMMAPTCLEVEGDYDMIIHLDGDAVVVGDLSEMIESDADIVGTLNNNVLNKAGANSPITTDMMKYDEENETYVRTGDKIPFNEWLNAGIIAGSREFFQAWDDLNMSIYDQLERLGVNRLAAPFGDENDTLNVVFHSGQFSKYIVDYHGSNVSYNITNLWGFEYGKHWESWKSLYVKDDKVFLNDPVNNVPCQIKILHQAGGSVAKELNQRHGGFRQWLRQAVPKEVAEFIDHVSN